MNKRHYEHTLPNIRGSLSNTYEKYLLKTIQPFYLLFYNLLIPFNSDLSFTSLMLIA